MTFMKNNFGYNSGKSGQTTNYRFFQKIFRAIQIIKKAPQLWLRGFSFHAYF
jgi:hypothetical protein